MAFSQERFAYGPFVPHWVPKQYIEGYFPRHGADTALVTRTTVEDISKLQNKGHQHLPRWQLTLRRFNPSIHQDEWWNEEFDAVVLANGHYSVPFVPKVEGLEEYMKRYPGRVIHSKQFRSPSNYEDKKVIVIGNSASGKDISTFLNGHVAYPLYQSRKSPSRWDGDEPPSGISWKPIITKYHQSGEIEFADGSILADVDNVIYCTGYHPSFPFWNTGNNGRPIYSYEEGRINGSYLHTFVRNFHTLAIIGIPRVLTFRSMEYQAIAVARVWAGRNSVPLPPDEEQAKWESDRWDLVKRENRKFHDITWDNGETHDYLQALYNIAGLPQLYGAGRYPPVLNDETRWAINHLKKYPEPKKNEEHGGFILVDRAQKDSLHFI
ncbi:hypothetical protein N7470_001585 [Penicillium chermesinum]|nr:hypothetical protein N7470_001585 [Penicillium chermesinum]